MSAGAAGGALVIEADGRYAWTTRAGRAAGTLDFCATANGDSGWALSRGEKLFWVRWVAGDNGGFHLFSTDSGSFEYKGTAIQGRGAAGRR